MDSTALLAWHKKLKLLHFAYIAACVAALFTLFIDIRITVGILVVCLIFHVFYLRPQVKSYCNAFNAANLVTSTAALLGDVTHKPQQGIEKSVVDAAHIIPTGTEASFLGRERISGRWNGMDICASDITACHSFLRGGKQHNEFISGCWIHATLKERTDCNYRILPNGLMAQDGTALFFEGLSDLQKQDIEKPSAMQAFSLYTTADSPLPANEVYARLAELNEYTTGLAAVAVHENCIDVFVKNRFLSRKVYLRETPSPERLQFPVFPELEYVQKLLRAAASHT